MVALGGAAALGLGPSTLGPSALGLGLALMLPAALLSSTLCSPLRLFVGVCVGLGGLSIGAGDFGESGDETEDAEDPPAWGALRRSGELPSAALSPTTPPECAVSCGGGVRGLDCIFDGAAISCGGGARGVALAFDDGAVMLCGGGARGVVSSFDGTAEGLVEATSVEASQVLPRAAM